MSRYPDVLPTKERLAKGDMDWSSDADDNIMHVWSGTRFVLDELVERRVLTDTHAFYGKTFLDMRRALHSPVSHGFNRMYFASEFFGEGGNGKLETAFLRVCRKLAPRTEGLVVYALETEVTKALRAKARLGDLLRKVYFRTHGEPGHISPQRYEAAFDDLIDAIDHVRSRTCKDCGAYEKSCACR